VLLFLTAGDDVGPGQFLVNGREDVVAELGPRYVIYTSLCKLLQVVVVKPLTPVCPVR